MAATKACEGLLRVLTTPPSTFSNIGEVTSWALEESANIKSYFKIGDCQEQSGVAGLSRTVTLEGNYDPDDAGQPTLLAVGDEVTAEIYPQGNASGKELYTVVGVVESVNRSGAGDDFLTFSATIRVNSFTPSVVP